MITVLSTISATQRQAKKRNGINKKDKLYAGIAGWRYAYPAYVITGKTTVGPVSVAPPGVEVQAAVVQSSIVSSCTIAKARSLVTIVVPRLSACAAIS
ncbi:hypothetical protein C6560_20395 [Enterobacter sp. FS01]|nr:hypothetical protein C6560_20395 [Enterobacter sp. FS01]